MTENKTDYEAIKGLNFGESYRMTDGAKYTRTFNGWIYSNFSGTAFCFIPDVPEVLSKETGFENEIVKKSAGSKKTK